MTREEERDPTVQVVDLGFDPVSEEIMDKLIDAMIAGMGRTPEARELGAMEEFARVTFTNFICLDLAMGGKLHVQRIQNDVPVFGVASQEEGYDG